MDGLIGKVGSPTMSMSIVRYFQIIYGLMFVSGPGSVVGMATGYGPDSPGIESRWGRDFPQHSRPALGPIQPPVQ
jgi:hypothetical protein